MKLYLAYGSNMSTQQLKRRCPESKLVKTALLKDYQLEFKSVIGDNAFATITKVKGAVTPVAVFEISKKDEYILDIYEGVSGNHYFKDDIEIEIDSKKYKCMAYFMNLDAKPALPSFRYVDVILEGYVEHGFDTKIIDDTILRTAQMINKK